MANLSEVATTDAGPRIEESWRRVLVDEFQSHYMSELRSFLRQELDGGAIVFPHTRDYFRAFDLTPFEKVRVVILGQDPYHGAGQAHGLCFSVRDGVAFPPSLLNIFKELQSDLGFPRPTRGDLSSWAQQGVLLLNSVLTVREGQAASHQGRGWERFTDYVVRQLNEQRQGIVFVLWGAYAQKKGALIDRKRHYVIESVHPSPLSASRGFFGSKPFSRINAYLRTAGQTEIDWRIP